MDGQLLQSLFSFMHRLLIASLTVATAVALVGPASALASGSPSAGDQQYVDPLAGASHPGSSHSKAPTTPAAPTPTPTPAASSTPVAATTPIATSPSSPTTATTATKSSSDPSGTALPMTGFNVLLVVLLGASLLASGVFLYRVSRGTTPITTLSSPAPAAPAPHEPPPTTGVNVRRAALLGGCLLASGAYLRRAVRRI